ncbi:type III secretion system inner membrane ring lipoprotein SctJ [Serratia marcescens]|nr:type III secretion inner membrane ring lipoprotein SctJ [Serratia marcescens]PIN56844.1 EscJ/YscJ/HrcJ family type III secretion inner membrane ring protein [Serratia marcescens]
MGQPLVKYLLTALCTLLIIGCSDETVLNSNLSESDANDIVAALNYYHITANKRVEKSGVSVLVAETDIERSVNILDAAGLPRKARTNLGEVFQKSGVISSPMEERARYIYALSQEVESTLSQIDGVVVARVHVVLPERIAPGEPVQPASASVFIKYANSLDPDSIEPRIRRLVATSIPGLVGREDKDLSIVFVLAKAWHDQTPLVNLGPFALTLGQYSLVKTLFSVLSLLLLFGLGIVALRRAAKKGAAESAGKAS